MHMIKIQDNFKNISFSEGSETIYPILQTKLTTQPFFVRQTPKGEFFFVFVSSLSVLFYVKRYCVYKNI